MSLYIYLMSEVADAAIFYIDDSKISSLSIYQEVAEKFLRIHPPQLQIVYVPFRIRLFI